ncbi:MAG TPA: VOC family protein [Acetobacteraceae bacterium]|jgi:catechol 2,3-dioxygenase|nr:VOC family protein [Acetobacteraceae bacterium]
MTGLVQSATEAQTPRGLNHIVLNVRDLEESHRFWTELLGFRHVGTLSRPVPDGMPRARMRFYSGERDGKLHHHDIALVEQMLPGDLAKRPQALNHVAIEYATQEAWHKQIAFLTAHGVTVYGRVDRGVTHSIHLSDPNGNEIELVHELPRELWEGDIDAALNRAVERPISE